MIEQENASTYKLCEKQRLKYKLMSKNYKVLYLRIKRMKLQMYRQQLIKSNFNSNYQALATKYANVADYYAIVESQETINAIYTVRKILEKTKKGNKEAN